MYWSLHLRTEPNQEERVHEGGHIEVGVGIQIRHPEWVDG